MLEIHNKIAIRGYESLSDEEVLTLLLEDRSLATSLMSECGSLRTIAKTPASRLRMVAG